MVSKPYQTKKEIEEFKQKRTQNKSEYVLCFTVQRLLMKIFFLTVICKFGSLNSNYLLSSSCRMLSLFNFALFRNNPLTLMDPSVGYAEIGWFITVHSSDKSTILKCYCYAYLFRNSPSNEKGSNDLCSCITGYILHFRSKSSIYSDSNLLMSQLMNLLKSPCRDKNECTHHYEGVIFD